MDGWSGHSRVASRWAGEDCLVACAGRRQIALAEQAQKLHYGVSHDMTERGTGDAVQGTDLGCGCVREHGMENRGTLQHAV